MFVRVLELNQHIGCVSDFKLMCLEFKLCVLEKFQKITNFQIK